MKCYQINCKVKQDHQGETMTPTKECQTPSGPPYSVCRLCFLNLKALTLTVAIKGICSFFLQLFLQCIFYQLGNCNYIVQCLCFTAYFSCMNFMPFKETLITFSFSPLLKEISLRNGV